MIGGYRLIELLGRGGMGEVYRAEREGPGGFRRRAAVKRILPRLQGDPNLRARFIQEARINGYLEHPNVVQVLDFGDQPEPYLALEYVEGTTAARVLKACAERGQRLPPVAVAYLVAEAATGLDYAHRREDEQRRPLQIVHRDVSPQNLLISLEGTIKVSDFGVARAVLSGAAPGSAVTKLAYAAPELLTGQPPDWRVDVFALGVVLWEMLLVRPLVPRSDPNAARQVLLSGRFDPPSRVDPQVPQPFDAVVLGALAVDPARRTESAGLLAQQLRALIHGIHPGFDATEFVRVLARTLPEIPWRAPSAPAPEPQPQAVSGAIPGRLATMPPPTREAPAGLAPMQPLQPMAGFGAPAAMPLGEPSPAVMAPLPPPAAPGFGGLPSLGPASPLDLSVPPSPRASLDVAPPPSAAIGPLPRPKETPSSGPSTRAITFGIAALMVVAAALVFWWITSSREPVRPPTSPGTAVAILPGSDTRPVAPSVEPTTPAPVPERPPAARDYTPRALAAISALEPRVIACLRADRNAAEECTASVTFDNANGAAVSSEVLFRAPRGSTARVQRCVQTALQPARFTTDPGASGLTRATKSWRMGRALSTGGGAGGGNDTIYFPFGVPRR
jgi:serine/threonine protein kinase